MADKAKSANARRAGEQAGVYGKVSSGTNRQRKITTISIAEQPRITTAQEKFIRDYRERWEDYFNTTGNRRALSVIECLTFALVEGGTMP